MRDAAFAVPFATRVHTLTRGNLRGLILSRESMLGQHGASIFEVSDTGD